MKRFSSLMLACAISVALASPVLSQPIYQFRGVDSRVEYSKLTQIGPWDDRNYTLTAEDLKLLAPNEAELRIPIPAWYRVALRKGIPEMAQEGPAQYPHSALPAYRLQFGGYLIDGELYTRAEYRDGKGRFEVLMEDGLSQEAFQETLEQRFLNGEVRVTSPNGAAESAIKINPVNNNLVIAGSNGPGAGQIMHYSTDGGDTWNQAAALPLGGTCCDPTVDWSSDGTLAYTSALGNCGAGGCQIWFYRSSDGGQTWNDLPGNRRTLNTGGGNDKEFIHVDKWSGSPHQDNIYATWHASNIMQFARSTDLGDTWSNITFSSASDQRGIGSDITTDKSGTVYYVWPAFNSQRILLARSTDGGASFGAVTEIASTEASFTFPVPSMETRDVFVYASADTDFSTGPYADSIYVAWSDSTASTGSNPSNNHARIQVAYSRDGGNSWTVTTPHETADQNSVDRYHQWLAVDASGRVHVIFYDTRRSAARTAVDVFYSFSDDGAQTWSTPSRVTASQSPNIGDAFEFGDYNGLDAVMSDLIAIYTDNRNEGGGGGDSVDVYAAGIPNGVAGDNPPVVDITAPADGSAVDQGVSVAFSATATDAEDGNLASGLAWTSSLDGAIGSGASFSTSSLSIGNHTITASVADSAAQTGSDSIALTITDPNSKGPQVAVFDAGLGAPACAVAGSSCDSTTLLEARGTVGPEQNQPNTLDGCTDGASGTYQSDESNERLVVSTLGGGDFAEGATVRIDATVWAWTTPSADSLDLYYTADASNPAWTFIATLQPSVAGPQVLSATYTLPAGSLQAVRANFRYQGSAGSCTTGNYDDADDLVFAVGGGAPECVLDGDCDDGLFCNGVETCGGGSCQSGADPCPGQTCNEATDTCESAQPVTVTFTSIGGEDGWVRESNETSDVGGRSNSTGAGSRPIRPGDGTQDRQYKSILSFDTSSIPAGATIQSATLRLRRGQVRGSNPFTSGFGACLVDVNTGGFSGSTALQNSDFQAIATAAAAATLTTPAANGDWSEGVLDAAGRAAINSAGTTQFRVSFAVDDNDDGGDDHMGYYSGDNANAANHPQLVVTYVP
ncbi:MAG: DNRLRE domain-containing protein [Acidobacteriota bacterium]